jgi:hypothetical protein
MSGAGAPQNTKIQVYGEDVPSNEEQCRFEDAAKGVELDLRSDIKNLIATELAMALYAPTPLQKLRHIFEAFELLTPSQQALLLRKEDIERAHRYRQLANCINDLQKTDNERAFIPFDFPISEAPSYLDFFTQWYRTLGASDWGDYRYRLAMYLKSGQASLAICFEVKSAFINTAMPFALSLFRSMFGSYIGTADLEAALERIGAYDGGVSSEA